jgi:tol-pal system protein YbgF
MRKILIPATFLIGLAMFVPARPALAVSKEIIQLQTQVQTLQDMLQQMQRSNSEQMGVLQHMIQQTNDSMTQISQQLNALGAKVDAESQNTQISGQIQGLNDSIDELKSHLNRIDATLGSMQSQLQNVSAPPPGSTAPANGAPANGAPPANGSDQPNQGAPQSDQQQQSGVGVPLAGGSQPQAGMTQGSGQESGAPPAEQAPPVGQLYDSAVSDYNGARYDLATSEFSQVIQTYPQSSQAGNAAFYLGEIDYRQGLYPAAIKNYSMVLNQYPASSKAPAAQLRKGEAELASSQREAGIGDLRALVRRYPVTPEGAQARSLLNGMGVRLVARKPSPYDAQ